MLTVVREVTRDHAKDEGHHHRFFTDFFHHLWHQPEADLRESLAHALPALMQACLAWDRGPVQNSLVRHGIDPAAAHDIVRECYDGAGTDRVAAICRATVRMCRSAGVLDVPGAVEAFATARLLSCSTAAPISPPT